MLSITRIRLVDVAVAALSSVEAVLIIDTEEESQRGRLGGGFCNFNDYTRSLYFLPPL